MGDSSSRKRRRGEEEVVPPKAKLCSDMLRTLAAVLPGSRIVLSNPDDSEHVRQPRRGCDLMLWVAAAEILDRGEVRCEVRMIQLEACDLHNRAESFKGCARDLVRRLKEGAACDAWIMRNPMQKSWGVRIVIVRLPSRIPSLQRLCEQVARAHFSPAHVARVLHPVLCERLLDIRWKAPVL